MVPMTVAGFVADCEADVKEKGMRIFLACGKVLISGILPKLHAVLDAVLDQPGGSYRVMLCANHTLLKRLDRISNTSAKQPV
jgi:hypothetical protein